MTELSRRAVLRAGALSAAALPFASVPLARATTSTGTLYRRARFKPLLNDTFTMADGTASWQAKLVSIEDVAGAPVGSDTCFRLVFRTTAAGPTQRTITLRRALFTATPLFVVPADTGMLTYGADVNRAT
jgi:hypothetical protein